MITIDVKGSANIAKKLQYLYPEIASAGVERASAFMLEVETDVSRAYAPPPYAGQPFVWSSERQRRYVMAKLRAEGGPPYVRKYTLLHGWRLQGSGENMTVVNAVAYAKFVKTKEAQIVGMKARKWQTIDVDLAKRKSWTSRKFNEAARDVIQEMGLA